jgi:hypothetical protein
VGFARFSPFPRISNVTWLFWSQRQGCGPAPCQRPHRLTPDHWTMGRGICWYVGDDAEGALVRLGKITKGNQCRALISLRPFGELPVNFPFGYLSLFSSSRSQGHDARCRVTKCRSGQPLLTETEPLAKGRSHLHRTGGHLSQNTHPMASRTHHHQLVPLQTLLNAVLLHSSPTSCMCDAWRPDDTSTSASISTDTLTSLNGWIRELKVGSLALLSYTFCKQAS